MSNCSTASEELVLDMFRFHPDEDHMVILLMKKMEGKGGGSKTSHFDNPETEINCQTLDLSPGSGNNQSLSTLVRFMEKMMMMMVQGNDSHVCDIIPEVDIYNSDPPDFLDLMLPDSPYKAKEWLSFNRPDYKNTVSSRRKRTTKKGHWIVTGVTRTMKSQQLPKSVTCKKRTLTYLEGHGSGSKATSWVMQEYFLSNKTQVGTKTSPNQRTDLVLCRLKYKSAANVKSDNSKKLKDSSNSDDLAACVNGVAYLTSNTICGHEKAAASENNHYMIPVAQKELACQHACLINDNHDYGFIQEQGEFVYPPFPSPEPPQPHQLPQMKNAPSVYADESSNWPSPNGDNIHYLTNEINISTSYELEPVSNNRHNFQNSAIDEWTPQQGEFVYPPSPLPEPPQPHQLPQMGNAPDFCAGESSSWPSPNGDNIHYLTNEINISTSYDNEPVSNNRRNFQNSAIDEWTPQQGEFLYPPSPLPEPPRPHQLPQMGNAPDVYDDESSNWPSPNGDNITYLTNEINISTGYELALVSNNGHKFQNSAIDEWTPQVDSQPELNLRSNFDPFQLQNYSLQSPIVNSEQGNLLYANNCIIGCNESQSQYSEFATLFP